MISEGPGKSSQAYRSLPQLKLEGNPEVACEEQRSEHTLPIFSVENLKIIKLTKQFICFLLSPCANNSKQYQ